MEAPSSLTTPKRKRPLPFEPTIPNLNQTRALTGLTGEFTFEIRSFTDAEDGSKSPRTTVAHRLQHLFLNGGGLGGTSPGGVLGGGIAPARTSTLTASQPSLSQPQQTSSQTQHQHFGYPFPRVSRSQDMQEFDEDHGRPDGPRKRVKLPDRDIDMTGVAETPMRPPASTNNGRTPFEATGSTPSSSMPPPSTPITQQSGSIITPDGPFPKRRLAPKGVQFNVDPTGEQHSKIRDSMGATSDTRNTQTPNSALQIPSSSPLSQITKGVANFNSTPTQRPLASKPANISMAPPSSLSGAAAAKMSRKSKTPPLQPQPAASTSTSSPTSPTITDPLRASLTWQDSEITIYDPDDSDDDGTGINGIGFKPTPEMEHARRMKRKKQLAEYRKREMGEARARRKERRAGADGLVGSGTDGGGPKGKDVIATAKGKLKAEKRRVRFMETAMKTVVELPPPSVTMMESVTPTVTQTETAAAMEVFGGTGVGDGGDDDGDTSVSGMAGAGADPAVAEA
ncbi:hypothetical protein SMACR_06071 [Sordaria macrospora]|uniref:WGS project CABT00000000 data, contig 2.32 n=2 Tax=Sordaria macrospora TaxID=5147 RepID=F7W5Z1_SORMK|nr:uncharacterized protein SMAC_06071 [Sordaria macrospora k-hell]KAA8629551.1 hypothetical protein SMACR_06071 [Sordaria macrospora]KAH7628159.1 hypothetical protein B0T09DRAFT_176022 [Sordaria sp. MPI-SDFR-AT-0083]WPJ65614.1 hypothetical protein SMAC4_06071 [Sordaria macrospora]CCC12929.1 unnamed protein product [Sordaria macrospora k-hell]